MEADRLSPLYKAAVGGEDGGAPPVVPVAVDEGKVRPGLQLVYGQLHGLHAGA